VNFDAAADEIVELPAFDEPLIEHIKRYLHDVREVTIDHVFDLLAGIRRHADLLHETFAPHLFQLGPDGASCGAEKIVRVVHEEPVDVGTLEVREGAFDGLPHFGDGVRRVTGKPRSFGDNVKLRALRHRRAERFFALTVERGGIDYFHSGARRELEDRNELVVRRLTLPVRDAVWHAELSAAQSQGAHASNRSARVVTRANSSTA
jgi:hypothetical protein